MVAGKMPVDENTQDNQRERPDRRKTQAINAQHREKHPKTYDFQINKRLKILQKTGNQRYTDEADDGDYERISAPDIRARLVYKTDEAGAERKQKPLFQHAQLRKNHRRHNNGKRDAHAGIDVLAGDEFLQFGSVIHGRDLCKISENCATVQKKEFAEFTANKNLN